MSAPERPMLPTKFKIWAIKNIQTQQLEFTLMFATETTDYFTVITGDELHSFYDFVKRAVEGKGNPPGYVK